MATGSTPTAASWARRAWCQTQKRQNVFGRASFDLSDDAEVYLEASYGRYWGFSDYDAPTYTGSTITIQPTNYFLHTLYPSLASKVTTPFTLGTRRPAPGSSPLRSPTGHPGPQTAS